MSMVHLVEVPPLISLSSPGLYARYARSDDQGLSYGPPLRGGRSARVHPSGVHITFCNTVFCDTIRLFNSLFNYIAYIYLRDVALGDLNHFL